MLSRVYMIAVVGTVLLPALASFLLATGEHRSSIDEVKLDVEKILLGLEQDPFKRFMGRSTTEMQFRSRKMILLGLGQDPLERFKVRSTAVLRFRSREQVRWVFEPLLDRLDPPEGKETAEQVLERWETASRAVTSGLLYHSFDLCLDKDLLAGLEAYLHLPGLPHFLEHGPAGNELHEEMQDQWKMMQSSCSEPKPFLISGWEADHVEFRLYCLRDNTRGALNISLFEAAMKRLNKSLEEWDPRKIEPWLALACFTRTPAVASPASLEHYLDRAVRGERCPYMLNAASLYLDVAEANKIARFMDRLHSLADSGDPGEKVPDHIVLHRFIRAAIPVLCSQEKEEAIRTRLDWWEDYCDPELASALQAAKKNAAHYIDRGMVLHGAFRELMCKLGRSSQLRYHGHRFMEL